MPPPQSWRILPRLYHQQPEVQHEEALARLDQCTNRGMVVLFPMDAQIFHDGDGGVGFLYIGRRHSTVCAMGSLRTQGVGGMDGSGVGNMADRIAFGIGFLEATRHHLEHRNRGHHRHVYSRLRLVSTAINALNANLTVTRSPAE